MRVESPYDYHKMIVQPMVLPYPYIKMAIFQGRDVAFSYLCEILSVSNLERQVVTALPPLSPSQFNVWP